MGGFIFKNETKLEPMMEEDDISTEEDIRDPHSTTYPKYSPPISNVATTSKQTDQIESLLFKLITVFTKSNQSNIAFQTASMKLLTNIESNNGSTTNTTLNPSTCISDNSGFRHIARIETRLQNEKLESSAKQKRIEELESELEVQHLQNKRLKASVHDESLLRQALQGTCDSLVEESTLIQRKILENISVPPLWEYGSYQVFQSKFESQFEAEFNRIGIVDIGNKPSIRLYQQHSLCHKMYSPVEFIYKVLEDSSLEFTRVRKQVRSIWKLSDEDIRTHGVISMDSPGSNEISIFVRKKVLSENSKLLESSSIPTNLRIALLVSGNVCDDIHTYPLPNGSRGDSYFEIPILAKLSLQEKYTIHPLSIAVALYLGLIL